MGLERSAAAMSGRPEEAAGLAGGLLCIFRFGLMAGGGGGGGGSGAEMAGIEVLLLLVLVVVWLWFSLWNCVDSLLLMLPAR